MWVRAPSTASRSVLQKCKLFWRKINFELKFANINGHSNICIYSITQLMALWDVVWKTPHTLREHVANVVLGVCDCALQTFLE